MFRGSPKNLARGSVTHDGKRLKFMTELDPQTADELRKCAMKKNLSIAELLRVFITWGLETVETEDELNQAAENDFHRRMP